MGKFNVFLPSCEQGKESERGVWNREKKMQLENAMLVNQAH